MEFQRILALRGPNIWARFPVLEAWLDLKDLKDQASSEIPGFNSRLQALLPTLVEHRCSEGTRGGFYQRLERGTYLAHILEHVALELQILTGCDVHFGKTRMTSQDGVYRVVVRYHNEALGRAALETGRRLCLAAVNDQPFDIAEELAKLKELHQRTRLNDLNTLLFTAARERNIPAWLLDGGGLLQLGQGARRHRVLNGLTDLASAIGGSIAYDWDLTRGLLQAVGVPISYAQAVGSADEAWSAAEYAELPVVVRPRYQSNRGKVLGPFDKKEDVQAAYNQAVAEGWSPLVEHAIPGNSYHLLMIGSKLACAKHEGEPVTSQVHPQVVARAADALRVVGLDIAQVNVIARDISLSLEEQGGVVVGVKSQPDLADFLSPELGGDLIGHLFPEGQTGRIPVAAVTGTNGKTTTTRLTAHLLGQVHAPVGMCCTEGIYVGAQRSQKGDCSGPKSARAVLQYPTVQAAVLEVARGGILREGLGFDRCDVAIVTNIDEGDHLGQNDIDTPEQLAYVKSTVVWTVLPTGYAVLNAADPLVVNMAQYCPGKVIYFARAADNPVLVSHRQQGGRVAFTRDNHLILAEGGRETSLISLERVPLTQGGRIGFHVENVLAAVAAAWAFDLPMDKICQGLESFHLDLENVPARFNLLDINGLTVILDYGHNPSALAKLFEVVDQFPHKTRTVMYSVAGDRRDEDIRRQGEMLGQVFDRIIIYEDTYLRGRQKGDITRLLRQGLDKGKRVKEILEVQGGKNGLDLAMAVSRPGDLLLIQPDLIDDGVAFLKKFLAAGGKEITLEDALIERKYVPAEKPANPKLAPGAKVLGAKLEVRSNHLGRAVYAGEAFQLGQKLLVGTGPFTRERSMHTIQVDDDLHILPDEPLRFLNHSCEPNCGLIIRRGCAEIEVHALADIDQGEELTLDYATFESEITALTGPCLCGTSSCRGRLRGYKDLPPALRWAYGRYIAEHLREADEPVIIPAIQEGPSPNVVPGYNAT